MPVKMLLFCKRGSKVLRDTFTSWSSTFFFLFSPFYVSPEGKRTSRAKSSHLTFVTFLFCIAGENHELHPAKQVQVLGKSISTPSIVVQVCGQEVEEVLYPNSKRIRGTKCPERQNSLDWKKNPIIIKKKKDQKLRKIMEWIILF